jgi:hypothetical protein
MEDSMAAMNSGSRISTVRLILIPSIITLAVTILRVVGELQHWPTLLFNPAPGGGGAIVGISWLPLIFGPYFGLKLAGAGAGPDSAGKAIGMAVLGILVFAGGGFLLATSEFASLGKLVAGLVLMGVAAALQFAAWPSLANTLLAYGYAARLPVAILMFFAILGDWGTHYDVVPPNFPEMDMMQKYFFIGFLPQMILWPAFTVIVGTLFGAIAAAIAHRRKHVTQVAA